MSLVALMLAVAVQAPPPSPPPVDCNDADHRAFDFWIGEWDVSPAGSDAIIAQSRIEKIADCAISETYHQSLGPGGKPSNYHGRSISSFVSADKGWRQFYVDNTGRAATLDGGVVDGAMVLSQQTPAGLTRMTVKPNADGSVRQYGELSTDGGKTWTSTFDFNYRRHR
jgi:hypothetical protein